MEIEHLFRSTALAVGLMEIENIIQYAPFAVGLKPSAMECKARLRGLYRIIYSKTISPRLWNAKPACAGYGGLCTQRPYALGQARRSPPAHPGIQARRLRTQACGRDARAPRHTGATPATPGMRVRRPRTQACGRDACTLRHAGATPAPPGMRVRRPRPQTCAGRNNAGTIVGCPGGKAPYRIKIWHQVGATCAR